jgi:hypothetical protein
MKCSNCPNFFSETHKDYITLTTTLRCACRKVGRDIAHDELDENGFPAWCPINKGAIQVKPDEIDKFATEDCQHSEKKPQGKCQIQPEMPDSIAGVPVSDLIFIAQIMGCNPRLIGQIKDGYAFGHAVGYEAGFKLFEKKLHEAILKMNSEPLRFEQEGNFDFTKVKFEIPPYKQHDEVINMARLYGVPVFTPRINVVNPSTDGDDKK